ncbi:MAG: flagellar basal-body rod protein FlgG [Planctomycetaceae bacterium]
MSVRAMHSAATGMLANEFSLDVIANNLANANTTGFKKSRVNFEDLFYQHLNAPGAPDANGQLSPVGTSLGLGTRVSGTQLDHTVGNQIQTGRQLDVAIQGDGFFQIQDTSEILYTRAGNFTVNSEGALVLASAGRGRLLEPSITIPPGTTEISIAPDGVVSAITPPATTSQQLGTIQTANFINPEGLLQRGDNLYSATDASGDPLIGQPGLEGRGSLRSAVLETSNVEPVKELINLIKTQRNFELNSQVVQAADQTLQLVANLRRF